MKTLFTILCLLACFYTAQAQKHADFVVLKNNDTIHGKVLPIWGKFMLIRVRLKNEEGVRRLKADEMLTFQYKGDLYRRKKFRHWKWEEDNFLKVETEGALTLMSLRCDADRGNYDLYAFTNDTSYIIVTRTNFNTQLLPVLQQSANFRQKTGGGVAKFPRYSKYLEKIVEMVRWYNEDMAPQQ